MRRNYVIRGAYVPRRAVPKTLGRAGGRPSGIDWEAVGSFVVLVWSLVALWSFYLSTGAPVPQ